MNRSVALALLVLGIASGCSSSQPVSKVWVRDLGGPSLLVELGTSTTRVACGKVVELPVVGARPVHFVVLDGKKGFKLLDTYLDKHQQKPEVVVTTGHVWSWSTVAAPSSVAPSLTTIPKCS
jgi:hypothetical protein